MNDNLPNHLNREAFSLSAFFPGDDAEGGSVSILKMPRLSGYSEKLSKVVPSSPSANHEIMASPVIEPIIESRYDVDDFGNPRILSGWEATLHAMAWPVVVGVVLGYALVIFLVAFHSFPVTKLQGKAIQAQVAWQDEAS